MLLLPCSIITRIHGIARSNVVNPLMMKAIYTSKQPLPIKPTQQCLIVHTKFSPAPVLPSKEYQTPHHPHHSPTHSQQSHHRPPSSHHSPRNLHRIRRRRPLSILTNNTNLRLAHARKVRLRARREGRKPGRQSGGGKGGLEVAVGIVFDFGLDV